MISLTLAVFVVVEVFAFWLSQLCSFRHESLESSGTASFFFILLCNGHVENGQNRFLLCVHVCELFLLLLLLLRSVMLATSCH